MENYLNRIIIGLCLLVFGLNLHFIQSKDKWSPIDEYAHYDYIDKLAHGTFPKLSDSISDELFLNIKNNPDKAVSGKIQTRLDLGFGNYSYQAKHPPLYYMTLLLPDIILKYVEVDIFSRLKILRIISYVLFVLGLLVCIPIAKLLTKLGTVVPSFYAWGAVLFGLIFLTHERYGLGNNLLSPLFVNASIYFLLNFFYQKKYIHLYLFILFSTLSICVALTTIFIIPLLILLLVVKSFKVFNLKVLLTSILFLIPAVAIFGAWQRGSVSEPAFEQQMQDVLANVIPANLIPFPDFLTILLDDFTRLSFLKSDYNLNKVFTILFICSMIVFVLFVKTIWNQQRWIVFVMIQFIAFLAILFFVNKYVPRVTWVAFRHYMVFIPIIYVGLTFWIVVLYKRIVKRSDY